MSNHSTLKSINQNIDTASLPLTTAARRYLNDHNASLAIQRQYLPSEAENLYLQSQLSDPIGDEKHTVTKGLVHRYPHKVLLKITDSCAAYCRFCFRKDMIANGMGILSNNAINNAIQYISNNNQINEIIFSGGDPLTLSNRRLRLIIDTLSTIDHLKIIRFHTRTPLINPGRLNDELKTILLESGKEIIVILHINHGDEITNSVSNSLKNYSDTSIVFKSQSVLLRGVNNNARTLINLFQKLKQNNVTPYYLHHMDKALGTKHFHVPIREGIHLFKQVQNKLPLHTVPQYTLDLPDGFGKVNLMSNNVHFISGNQYQVTDPNGQIHTYFDEGL